MVGRYTLSYLFPLLFLLFSLPLSGQDLEDIRGKMEMPDSFAQDGSLIYNSSAALLGDGTLVTVVERRDDGQFTLGAQIVDDIWLKRRLWNPTELQTIVPSDSRFRNYPDLVPDGDGGLHLFFVSGKSNGDQYHLYRSHSSDGKEWAEPEKLSIDLDVSAYMYPDFCRGPNGTVYVTFTAFLDNEARVFVSESTDLEEWSSPRNVGSGRQSSFYVHDGQLVLMYETPHSDREDATEVVWRTRAMENGASWSEPRHLWKGQWTQHPTASTAPDGSLEFYFLKVEEETVEYTDQDGETQSRTRQFGNVHRRVLSPDGELGEPVHLSRPRRTGGGFREFHPGILEVPPSHMHTLEDEELPERDHPFRYLYWSRTTGLVNADLFMVGIDVEATNKEDGE